MRILNILMFISLKMSAFLSKNVTLLWLFEVFHILVDFLHVSS